MPFRARPGFWGGGFYWLLIRQADRFHGCDEPIAAPRESFDKAGVAGTVSQGFADAVERGVDAVIGINKGIVRPQATGNFLASDQVPRALEEHKQDLKWLRIQLDAKSPAAQFTRGGVRFERAKAITRGWGWFRHVFE